MKKCILIVAIAVATSACSLSARRAVVAPDPSPEQVQSVRHIVNEIALAANAGLTIADRSGAMIATMPGSVLTADQKRQYQCALVKVFGTSTQASQAVVSACGQTPLSAESPFTKAVEHVKSVGVCPGLGSSAAALMGVIEPVIADLERSSQQAVSFAGVSLRVALGYVSRVAGGDVPCR